MAAIDNIRDSKCRNIGENMRCTIENLNNKARKFDDILFIQKAKQPGTIQIVCKPGFDEKEVEKFTESLPLEVCFIIKEAL